MWPTIQCVDFHGELIDQEMTVMYEGDPCFIWTFVPVINRKVLLSGHKSILNAQKVLRVIIHFLIYSLKPLIHTCDIPLTVIAISE